jgi:uncharacterized protein (DUF2252 family)
MFPRQRSPDARLYAPVTEPARYLPRSEREAYGKWLRERVRRVDQDRWVNGERDVLARLRASEAGRRPELLPVRRARMAASPFGFLRGGASIMAPDLAALPSTGYLVQLCGDAHVRNLGAASGPDGQVVFDLNDFDETCRGPWEWDLKRLAISIALVSRNGGNPDKVGREAVQAMVRSWRTTLHELVDVPAYELARYHVHRYTPDGPVGRLLDKARRISPLHVRDQLTTRGPDGRPRFRDDDARLTRLPDDEARQVLAALAAYRDTLGPACQQVLDAYLPCDVAGKLAGTGSVGARNYAILCIGNGGDDLVFLQLKEALPSCYLALGLVPADPRVSSHQGRRVAEGQHRMQTWADPFLGWTTAFDAPFYVRQLADHKASIDPTDLRRSALIEYARVCGEVFAKAHARTADAAVLSGYAGKSEKLDTALASLALTAADQVTRDWTVLVGAIARGELLAADQPTRSIG